MEIVNIYYDYDSKHGVEDDLVGEIYANDYDLITLAPTSTSSPSTPAPRKKILQHQNI
jgi:hypothetical protein